MVWNSTVYFYFIHFHSKCIVNKHLFYPFLLFIMVKTILTKHSLHPLHPFYPFHSFLLFRMVKIILTISNKNDQNDQKWVFQTGLKSSARIHCKDIILLQLLTCTEYTASNVIVKLISQLRTYIKETFNLFVSRTILLSSFPVLYISIFY